jgi:hypothetical protein
LLKFLVHEYTFLGTCSSNKFPEKVDRKYIKVRLRTRNTGGQYTFRTEITTSVVQGQIKNRWRWMHDALIINYIACIVAEPNILYVWMFVYNILKVQYCKKSGALGALVTGMSI